MSVSDEKVTCRNCGEARLLASFRYFTTSPLLYMDFCVECEKSEGTLTLYRRFTAYATPEIVTAVFAASRVPSGKRTAEQKRLLVQAQAAKEPTTNTEVIIRELARRELARRRLIYFTTTFAVYYKPGWVHHDICQRLERFVERVERGESPRLMIFMPPRAGKSTLASDMFPSWCLGKHPEWGIIAASYNISLPIGFSRNIRDRLRDPEFGAIFEGARLRPDSQGVEEWKTTRGGGFIAAGVGVGVNGKGMHIGIADDLLKDQEAAQSETIRENTYNWYMSVFRTRLTPGGGILFINTRWHDADPSGKLLSDEKRLRLAGVPEEELEGWEVISYPAIAEHDEYLMSNGTIQMGRPAHDEDNPEYIRLLRRKGEALHPERYSLTELKKLKNSLAPSIWAALYQQNPTPDDGEFFKKDDFRYRYLPREYWTDGVVFTVWDFAITKGARNDWTVGGVFVLTHNNELYLVDVRRGRWGTKEIVDNIIDVVKTYKPDVFAGERGQIYAAVWPLIAERLEQEKLNVSVDETLVPITDKEARARPLQGRMQMHKVFFSYDPRERPPVYDTVEKELLRFPNATHDDCVDMMAWGARMSMNLSLPSRPQPKKLDSWKDHLPKVTGHAGSHMAA